MSDRVRTVIINYKTPDLLKVAIESYRSFYKNAPILIIDNGSKDESNDVIKKLVNITPENTKVLYLESNMFHGPAMHRAMNEVNEEFVFFLDSDTETKHGGFLEAMVAEFDSSKGLYGIGRYLTVNQRGFQVLTGEYVLAPAYMMIRRSMYFMVPPFEHHGLPVLKNNIAAKRKGYEIKYFPIQEYIDHRWRGTASRFGYGLGWRGKLDFVLNKLGI